MVGLLDTLTFDQQSTMVYIGYFNRAADSGGFSFWSGQNTKAQGQGQSAADAIKNIANSFTPQTETHALYPFLSTATFDPKNADTVASIGSLVDGIYANLFGRTPAANDGGRLYWVNQILTGAVGIGESVLLIANGATGADATLLQNKITVALDFTTRTGMANLGITSAPPDLLLAAKSAPGVTDGIALQDAAVTAGKSITTTYINRVSGPTLTLSGSVLNPATIDASVGNTVNFAISADSGSDSAYSGPGSSLADLTIRNMTGTKDISDLTGVDMLGKVNVTMATGETTLNLDLGAAGNPALFAGGETRGNGIGITGVKAINITSNGVFSNGSFSNTVQFYAGSIAGSVDGITTTVTGSTGLELGRELPFFPKAAFQGVIKTGETINAGAFTGALTYHSSGKGDTVTGGSGSDKFFTGAKDVITTGAGSDIVNLNLTNYVSPTAADITFITDFAAGTDKIQTFTPGPFGFTTNGFGPTTAFYDDTGSTMPGGKLDLASAAQQAFKDFVGGGAEQANSVVSFRFSANLYDAISVNGTFASSGYFDSGNNRAANIIVKITGATGTQTSNDFLLNDLQL
jgi:hypothetical protein